MTERTADAAICAAAGLDITIPVPGGDPVHAVRHADLELVPGRVHGLVGGSGSGKSTLGRALMGLVPPGSLVSGKVVVDGRDLVPGDRRDAAYARSLRGRVFGFIPQSPATSFTPVRRIGYQLSELVRALGGSEPPSALLDRVHLEPPVLDAFPHQLSGGMAQRAAAAFALAGGPRVLIADEPTSALDPELTTAVLRLISAIADEGLAVLVISHDVEDLKQTGVCDDVSVMRHGDIVEQGPASRVLQTPQHVFTQAMLNALPSGGMHLTKGFEKG